MCGVYVGHENKRGTVVRKYNYLREGRELLEGEEVTEKDRTANKNKLYIIKLSCTPSTLPGHTMRHKQILSNSEKK